jgi:hypothetical protein
MSFLYLTDVQSPDFDVFEHGITSNTVGKIGEIRKRDVGKGQIQCMPRVVPNKMINHTMKNLPG